MNTDTFFRSSIRYAALGWTVALTGAVILTSAPSNGVDTLVAARAMVLSSETFLLICALILTAAAWVALRKEAT